MTIRRVLGITGRVLLIAFIIVTSMYGIGLGFYAAASEPLISAIALTVTGLLVVGAAKAYTLLGWK